MGRRVGDSDPVAHADAEAYYKRLIYHAEARPHGVPLPTPEERDRGELPYDQEALHARWELGWQVQVERGRVWKLPVAARLAHMERFIDDRGLLDEARQKASGDA